MHSAKIHPKNPDTKPYQPPRILNQGTFHKPNQDLRATGKRNPTQAASKTHGKPCNPICRNKATDRCCPYGHNRFLGKMSEPFPDSATKEYQKMSEICPKKVKFYRYKRGISLLALFF